MTSSTVETLQLHEWEEAFLPKDRLGSETARALIEDHTKHVDLDYPSPKTDGHWRLGPKGYIGILPVDRDTVLALEPKVPIENVFRMLEYAYRLRAFPWPDKTIHAESIAELFESLARILARRIRDRTRKGLHRRYVERDERLPFVRGRVELRRAHRLLWDPSIHCHFEEHTPDHSGNRILLWTLLTILRSGILGRKAGREVGGAARALRGAVSIVAYSEADCARQHYDRLSHDYEALHALCRFFLSQTGPSQQVGERQMSPFLLKMDQLFEAFVARWLREQLPRSRRLSIQESGSFDPLGEIEYRMDLVLYERGGRPLTVLDTKYKKTTQPQGADVHQVVTYAVEKGCREAILVYPQSVVAPKEFFVGPVRVRTAGFPLDRSVDEGGAEFLGQLGLELMGLAQSVA